MIQVVKQTDKEKLAMYMKCTKIELAKMLIQSNKLLFQTSGEFKIDKQKIIKIMSTTTQKVF